MFARVRIVQAVDSPIAIHRKIPTNSLILPTATNQASPLITIERVHVIAIVGIV